MKAVLPALARPLIEPQLPRDLDVTWFTDMASAKAGLADAEIAWVDMQPTSRVAEALRAAGPALRWVTTIYAGLDAFPLDRLRERRIIVTNGSGINAAAVADYAVLGVLVAAKRFDQVVRAHDRREWLRDVPGKVEPGDTAALIVGHGTIGRMIGDRLSAFGVAVTGVTRSGRDGTLTADQWRGRLGEYDWVILAAPSTGATQAMIGPAELAAIEADRMADQHRAWRHDRRCRARRPRLRKSRSAAPFSTRPIPSRCPPTIRCGAHPTA